MCRPEPPEAKISAIAPKPASAGSRTRTAPTPPAARAGNVGAGRTSASPTVTAGGSRRGPARGRDHRPWSGAILPRGDGDRAESVGTPVDGGPALRRGWGQLKAAAIRPSVAR